MTDYEWVRALFVIWVFWFGLTVADVLVHSERVDREKPSGVAAPGVRTEGRSADLADNPKAEKAADCRRLNGLCDWWVQFAKPGGESGLGFSRFARRTNAKKGA